jgi:hypothetical protein
LHELAVVFVVGGIELAPAILFFKTGFNVLHQLLFSMIAELL